MLLSQLRHRKIKQPPEQMGPQSRVRRGWYHQLQGMLGDPGGKGLQAAGASHTETGKNEMATVGQLPYLRRGTHMGTSQIRPRGHPGRSCGHLDNNQGNLVLGRDQQSQKAESSHFCQKRKPRAPAHHLRHGLALNLMQSQRSDIWGTER